MVRISLLCAGEKNMKIRKSLAVLLILLFVFGLAVAASTMPLSSKATIEKALCTMVKDIKSMAVTASFLCSLPTILLVGIGAWLFLQNKDKPGIMKWAGAVIVIITLIIYALIVVSYILAPILIGMATGTDITKTCAL